MALLPSYQDLRNNINEFIKTNLKRQITGAILNNVLHNIIDTVRSLFKPASEIEYTNNSQTTVQTALDTLFTNMSELTPADDILSTIRGGVPATADTLNKLYVLIQALQNSKFVADITERDALELTANALVTVQDASADAEVDSGAALYYYDVVTDTYQLLAKYENVNLSFTPAGSTGEVQLNINGAIGSNSLLSFLNNILQVGNGIKFGGDTGVLSIYRSIIDTANTITMAIDGIAVLNIMSGKIATQYAYGPVIKSYPNSDISSRIIYGFGGPGFSNSGIAVGQYDSNGTYKTFMDVIIEGVRVARFNQDGNILDPSDNSLNEASALTFSNGLTKDSSGNVTLGGDLSSDVSIAVKDKNLHINAVNTSAPTYYSSFIINNNSIQLFQRRGNYQGSFFLAQYGNLASPQLLIRDNSNSNDISVTLTLAGLMYNKDLTNLTGDYSRFIPDYGGVRKEIQAAIAGIGAGGAIEYFVGDFDASAMALPTTGTGTNNAIVKGNYWRVSVGNDASVLGKLASGDVIHARVAGASSASDFFVTEGNQDYAAALARISELESEVLTLQEEVTALQNAQTAINVDGSTIVGVGSTQDPIRISDEWKTKILLGI